MHLRAATLGDLDRLVQVHMSGFPGFFLTRMGSEFLREFYRLGIVSPASCVIVAVDGDEVVGFVSGYTKPSEFYMELRRHWVRFILPMSKGILRDPRLLGRVLGNRIRVSNASKQGSTAAHTAELASLCVAPQECGKGVGNLLVRAFAEVCATQQIEYICLTTDALDNDAVNAFYVKAGFQLEGLIKTRTDRQMCVYRMEL